MRGALYRTLTFFCNMVAIEQTYYLTFQKYILNDFPHDFRDTVKLP